MEKCKYLHGTSLIRSKYRECVFEWRELIRQREVNAHRCLLWSWCEVVHFIILEWAHYVFINSNCIEAQIWKNLAAWSMLHVASFLCYCFICSLTLSATRRQAIVVQGCLIRTYILPFVSGKPAWIVVLSTKSSASSCVSATTGNRRTKLPINFCRLLRDYRVIGAKTARRVSATSEIQRISARRWWDALSCLCPLPTTPPPMYGHVTRSTHNAEMSNTVRCWICLVRSSNCSNCIGFIFYSSPKVSRSKT